MSLVEESATPLLEEETPPLTESAAPAVPQQQLNAQQCRSPRRVMLVLILSLLLVFIDRGAIGTNAVNGHERREGRETAGIRVCFPATWKQLTGALCLKGDIRNVKLPEWSHPCLFDGWSSARKHPHCATSSTLASCNSGSYWDVDMDHWHNWMWSQLPFWLLCVLQSSYGHWPSAIVQFGPRRPRWTSFIDHFSCELMGGHVDDVAPPDRVATWLSVYQLACPMGTALGFWYGSLIGSTFSWRHSFYFQSILAAPILLLSFTEKKFYLKKSPPTESEHEERFLPVVVNNCLVFVDEDYPKVESLPSGMKTIFTHVLFNLSLIGSSLYRGYLTTTEYWVARALEAKFNRDGSDIVTGTVIFVSSTIGTFAGGKMMDSLLGVWVVMVVGELVCDNYYGMIAVYTIMFMHLFAPLGAVGVAVMWTVPIDLRPLAKVVEASFTQLLGTIPEPALYGAFLDILEDGNSEKDSHRYAMTAVTAFVVVASVLFLIGAYISPKHPHYRVNVSSK